MKKVLFIMHEGIGSTIFHSQIAVHAKEMKKLGFEVDIWTFETNPRHIHMSRRNLSDVDSILSGHLRLYFGVYQFIPFSDFFNALFFVVVFFKAGFFTTFLLFLFSLNALSTL